MWKSTSNPRGPLTLALRRNFLPVPGEQEEVHRKIKDKSVSTKAITIPLLSMETESQLPPSKNLATKKGGERLAYRFNHAKPIQSCMEIPILSSITCWHTSRGMPNSFPPNLFHERVPCINNV
ncbi:hypothetical protein AAC387_Pa03g3794 [Persea americana]